MLRLDVSSCQALVVSQRWLEKVTEDGLSHREYVAQYGQSQEVARALIDAG